VPHAAGPRSREQSKRDGKDQHQHVAKQVARKRNPGERDEPGAVINRRVARGGGDDRERNGNRQTCDQGCNGERERGREASAQFTEHRLSGAVGGAEVTLRCRRDPSDVAREEGAIEPELPAKLLHLDLGRWIACPAQQHHVRRIAGRQ